LGDQILNFGPDFLKNVELWLHILAVVKKSLQLSVSSQNFVGQSSNTSKLCVKDPKIFDSKLLWGTLAKKLSCQTLTIFSVFILLFV